jgi:hypothetical protein
MDNAAKLVEKIKQENLRPKARWRFTLKNVMAWLGFVSAAFIGAVSFSVILFAIQQVDFNVVDHISHSLLELFLSMIPMVWILCLIVFVSMAAISLQYSKKAYKLGSLKLIGLCVAFSILTGTLFFYSGGAKWLEQAFDTNIDIYESIQDRKTKMWTQPTEGYLSGIIQSVDDNAFELRDFTDKLWQVEYQDVDIVPSVSVIPNEKIKMIGKMTGDNKFIAEKIRPWGGEFRQKRHNQNK